MHDTDGVGVADVGEGKKDEGRMKERQNAGLLVVVVVKAGGNVGVCSDSMPRLIHKIAITMAFLMTIDDAAEGSNWMPRSRALDFLEGQSKLK